MAKEASEPEATVDTDSPQTALDFFERGWRHYSKHDYPSAEADFKKSLEISPDYVDAVYGLGMAYQASGQPKEAVEAFQKVITLLEQSPIEDISRARMLVRFSRGHINRIQTGDWHIES